MHMFLTSKLFFSTISYIKAAANYDIGTQPLKNTDQNEDEKHKHSFNAKSVDKSGQNRIKTIFNNGENIIINLQEHNIKFDDIIEVTYVASDPITNKYIFITQIFNPIYSEQDHIVDENQLERQNSITKSDSLHKITGFSSNQKEGATKINENEMENHKSCRTMCRERYLRSQVDKNRQYYKSDSIDDITDKNEMEDEYYRKQNYRQSSSSCVPVCLRQEKIKEISLTNSKKEQKNSSEISELNTSIEKSNSNEKFFSGNISVGEKASELPQINNGTLENTEFKHITSNHENQDHSSQKVIKKETNASNNKPQRPPLPNDETIRNKFYMSPEKNIDDSESNSHTAPELSLKSSKQNAKFICTPRSKNSTQSDSVKNKKVKRPAPQPPISKQKSDLQEKAKEDIQKQIELSKDVYVQKKPQNINEKSPKSLQKNQSDLVYYISSETINSKDYDKQIEKSKSIEHIPESVIVQKTYNKSKPTYRIGNAQLSRENNNFVDFQEQASEKQYDTSLERDSNIKVKPKIPPKPKNLEKKDKHSTKINKESEQNQMSRECNTEKSSININPPVKPPRLLKQDKAKTATKDSSKNTYPIKYSDDNKNQRYQYSLCEKINEKPKKAMIRTILNNNEDIAFDLQKFDIRVEDVIEVTYLALDPITNKYVYIRKKLRPTYIQPNRSSKNTGYVFDKNSTEEKIIYTKIRVIPNRKERVNITGESDMKSDENNKTMKIGKHIQKKTSIYRTNIKFDSKDDSMHENKNEKNVGRYNSEKNNSNENFFIKNKLVIEKTDKTPQTQMKTIENTEYGHKISKYEKLDISHRKLVEKKTKPSRPPLPDNAAISKEFNIPPQKETYHFGQNSHTVSKPSLESFKQNTNFYRKFEVTNARRIDFIQGKLLKRQAPRPYLTKQMDNDEYVSNQASNDQIEIKKESVNQQNTYSTEIKDEECIQRNKSQLIPSEIRKTIDTKNSKKQIGASTSIECTRQSFEDTKTEFNSARCSSAPFTLQSSQNKFNYIYDLRKNSEKQLNTKINSENGSKKKSAIPSGPIKLKRDDINGQDSVELKPLDKTENYAGKDRSGPPIPPPRTKRLIQKKANLKNQIKPAANKNLNAKISTNHAQDKFLEQKTKGYSSYEYDSTLRTTLIKRTIIPQEIQKYSDERELYDGKTLHKLDKRDDQKEVFTAKQLNFKHANKNNAGFFSKKKEFFRCYTKS